MVALGCAALAIWGWHELREMQRSIDLASTANRAENLAAGLEAEARRQLETLQQLSDETGDDTALPGAGPAANGAAMALALPGLLDVKRVAPAAERPARENAAAELIGPVMLSSDRLGYRLRVPSRADGSAIVASFDLRELIEGLAGSATRYHVALRWNDRSVAAGAPAPERPAGDEAAIEAWHPLAREPWLLVVRRGPGFAWAPRSPLPAVFLVTGLVAAGTIGALFWSVRLARRRARALAETNQALGQILDAARAELHASEDGRSSVELQISERTRELRDAVAELDAFNASISHDLRSPIGAIVNFASLVRATQTERLDEEGKAFLLRIESAAQRALARMDGLLLFSRIGRQPIERETVDLASIGRRLAQEQQRARPDVHFEITIDRVPTAQADPRLVELLLRQLLDNAAKFSAASSKPQIELGAVDGDAAGEVVYYVRENGVGFDPRHAERLFGLFERAHRSGEYDGAGVGLAIASRIVRRHGGRIWAESAPSRGATFFFTLEAVPDDEREVRESGPVAG